jgi:hypothetical protein
MTVKTKGSSEWQQCKIMFANLSNKNTLKRHFSIIRSTIKVAVSNYRSYSCWMRFQVSGLIQQMDIKMSLKFELSFFTNNLQKKFREKRTTNTTNLLTNISKYLIKVITEVNKNLAARNYWFSIFFPIRHDF